MTTIRATLATAAILATATIAHAQGAAERVDHRDARYAPGFFDTLAIGTPVAGRPGAIWQHDGQGWLQATPAAPVADPVRASIAPPAADEYAMFVPYGTGQSQRYVVRTADRRQWFQGGKTYWSPYNYEMRIGRIEFRCADLGYGEVCDLFQIGTITVSSGDPEVGTEIPFRLFAPKGPWQEVVR